MDVKLEVNKKYLPYLYDYSQRYNIYYGGRGSGKSHFIVDKLILKALSSKRKVLFIRKTATSLKDSSYQLVLDTLSRLHITRYCQINKSTYTITLPNESVLLFKGLDDGEKAKGIQGITDIFVDEANQLTLEEFKALDFSLRHPTAPDQQIYLAYNPVSKANWVYKYWHIETQPNTFYLHSTYKDNHFLPQSQIDAIEDLQRTNPTLYKIVGLGEFASLDKLIYPLFVIQDFNHREVQGTYIYGLDFGYTNDPSAFIAAKVDTKTKVLYIFDEHYQTGMLNDAIANLIKYKGYAKEIIIADAAEPKSIEEIKRHGIARIRAAHKGQGSVLQGIQLIQQYQLIAHPSCTNTITELQNYSWKKDKSTGEYINEPVDDYNHLMDALRYAIQTIEQNNRLQVIRNFRF